MRKFSTLAMLAVVLLFLACGKDSDEVKLLESVTHDMGLSTIFSPTDASKNNVIKEGYQYQYDSDGFLTSRSWDSESGDSWNNDFEYRGKK